MKTLVIYDSFFGNTKLIAEAIFEGFNSPSNGDIFYVKDFLVEDLKNYQFLLIGSPTRGFRPSPAIDTFIKSIPKNGLKKVFVCTFDTRLLLDAIHSKVLRFIVKTGGYAAKPMSRVLQKKGGILISEPQGFYVSDEKGPLAKQEIERAKEWGGHLMREVTSSITL